MALRIRVHLVMGGDPSSGEPNRAMPVPDGPELTFELSNELSGALGRVLRTVLGPTWQSLAGIHPAMPGVFDTILRSIELSGGGARADIPAVVLVLEPAEPKAVTARRAGVLDPGEAPLTVLERSIVDRVAGGETDGQIAEALYMSRRTVQNPLSRIRRKTGLRTRAELIRWSSKR